MKPSARVPLLVVVLALIAAPAFAGGNANFVLGSRSLDKDFWEPVESQGVFGATVDFGKEDWPVQLAIGLYVSTAEKDEYVPFIGSIGFRGTISELSFGVLKTWKPSGNIRPYVGGGLAYVTATAEFDFGLSFEDDDSSGAVYAQGGVYWRIGRRFNIGVDARALLGSDVSFDFGGLIPPAEGDADYFQIGLLMGWGWPAGK